MRRQPLHRRSVRRADHADLAIRPRLATRPLLGIVAVVDLIYVRIVVAFGIVSTATFAGAQLFYFAASFILGGAEYLKTFSPDQINTLALLSLKFAAYGSGIFMIFYGVASFIRGYLIYRSAFLPRFLGVLLMLGGLGFIVRNFALVLAPAYASGLFLMPMFIAGISLTAWFLIKGVDVQKWEARAQRLS